ncbi:hypothetical protein [Nostoc sp. KVJ20]|nr:hypothetical protein [Nostoc sp. KVJ20]
MKGWLGWAAPTHQKSLISTTTPGAIAAKTLRRLGINVNQPNVQ